MGGQAEHEGCAGAVSREAVSASSARPTGSGLGWVPAQHGKMSRQVARALAGSSAGGDREVRGTRRLRGFDMTNSPQNQEDDSPTSPRWLDLTEQALLEDCRVEVFRGSGPGGQKRNKTSSAVRVTHQPTGIHALGTESRSQAENKTRAIRRLKLRLATELRHPIDSVGFEPPAWFGQVVQVGRLAVSHRNEHYARAAALVLDLLDARRGSIGDAAKLLGVTTSSVVKFLEEEPALWTAANGIRKLNGQAPLEKRRG